MATLYVCTAYNDRFSISKKRQFDKEQTHSPMTTEQGWTNSHCCHTLWTTIKCI